MDWYLLFALLFSNKGEQAGLAGAFDGDNEHALIKGAGAGDATGKNLPAVGEKSSEQVHVFVVDERDLVFSKIALLSGAFHFILRIECMGLSGLGDILIYNER